MIRKKKAFIELLQKKNQLLEENYQTLHQTYEADSRLYHDIHNHLNLLYQMLEQEQFEEAQQYIRSISTPVHMLSRQIWTNIPIVDAILNSKSQEAGQRHIAVNINAEYPEGTGIASDDLCIILTNLLDNAIEASVKEPCEEKRYIRITIRRIQQMILIRTENNSPVPPGKKHRLFSTSKADSHYHGWGIKNVLRAAQQYHGSASFDYQEGSFTATVMLSYPSCPGSSKP